MLTICFVDDIVFECLKTNSNGITSRSPTSHLINKHVGWSTIPIIYEVYTHEELC